MQKISKHFYWTYITDNINYSDSSCHMWSLDLYLDPVLLGEEWEAHLLNARKISIASKLRYLQFKILNRTLITNIRRSKWDSSISELCTFCQECPESIKHILVDCRYAQVTWKALHKWIKDFYGLQDIEPFTASEIILNNYKGSQKHFVNTLILVLKQYLYSSKCKNVTPNFTDYLSSLDYWHNIEKIAAYQAQKIKTFYKKWKYYTL